MIYKKNVFKWEQALRVLFGVAVGSWPWLGGAEPAFLYVAMGGFVALTGVVGFCPACYMAGRKTPDFSKPQNEVL